MLLHDASERIYFQQIYEIYIDLMSQLLLLVP